MADLLTVEALKEQLAKKLKLAPGQRFPARLNSVQQGNYNQFLRDYALSTGMDNIHIKDGKPVINKDILARLGKQIADYYNQPTTNQSASTVVLAKNNTFITAPIADAQTISAQQTQAAQARLAEEAKIVEKNAADKAARAAAKNPEPAPPPPEVFSYMRVDSKTVHKEKNIDFILLQMGVTPGTPEYEAKKQAFIQQKDHEFPRGPASKGGVGNKSAYLKIAQDGSFEFTNNPPLEADGHTVAFNKNNSTKAGGLEVWQTSNDVIVPATVKVTETVLPLDRVLRELASVGAADFNKRTRTYTFFESEQFDADIEQAVKGVLSKYPQYIQQDVSSAQIKTLYEAFKKHAENPKACMVPQPKTATSLAAFETVDELDTTTRFRTDYALINRVKDFTPNVVSADLVLDPALVSEPAITAVPTEVVPQNVDNAMVTPQPVSSVAASAAITNNVNLVDLLPDMSVTQKAPTVPVDLTDLLPDDLSVEDMVEDRPSLKPLVASKPEAADKKLSITKGGLFDKAWKKVTAAVAGVVLVGGMVFAGARGTLVKSENVMPKDSTKQKTVVIAKTPASIIEVAQATETVKPQTVDIGQNALPKIDMPTVQSGNSITPKAIQTSETKPTPKIQEVEQSFSGAFAKARKAFLNNQGPDTFAYKDENGNEEIYTTDIRDEVVQWFKDNTLDLTGDNADDHKIYLDFGREYKNNNVKALKN